MASRLGLLGIFLLLSCLENQVLGDIGTNGQYYMQRRLSTNCDYYQGRWVQDQTYPLYNSGTCSFIGGQFDCQKNGRPDKAYLMFRWQPLGCDIPRFNGVDFLRTYRGKRILFVGDSISHNMWVSLACLLHAAVPKSAYTVTDNKDKFSTFTLPDYNISVSFLKNPYLVDVVPEKIGRVLKLDSLGTANQWLGMDVLIYNTHHWWFHKGNLQDWDFIQSGGEIVKDMDRLEALRIALTTWANWVDKNINPVKNKVFFQGPAATHYIPKEWGNMEPNAKACIEQTEPIEGPKFPGSGVPGVDVVKGVISKMRTPAHLLDISLLTQLRKDGHPSLYSQIGGGDDCSHWCLAGVPDAWNQLLYVELLRL